ncbi:hypothetical protein D3C81_1268800 [compost metagenome]
MQQHADAHAPHEHPGDLPALLRHAGFLLDQRRHDQRLVRIAIRHVAGALRPFLGQHFFQARVGLLEELDVAHAAHEAVGIGEEAPFREHSRMAELVHDLGVAEAVDGFLDLLVPGQRRTYLAEIPALDQGQGVLHYITTAPDLEQVAHGHARSHAVFAGMQGYASHVEAPVQAQPEGVFQHTVALHTVEHAVGSSTGGHVEQLLLGHVQGLLQRRLHLPGRIARHQAGQDQPDLQQHQEFTSHKSGIQ